MPGKRGADDIGGTNMTLATAEHLMRPPALPYPTP